MNSDQIDKAIRINRRIAAIENTLEKLGLELADLYMVEEAEEIIAEKITELRAEKKKLEDEFDTI